MDSKIKQDKSIPIGQNIREIRLARGIGQTELVCMVQLQGVTLTRESLVKIERGIQHVYASQLSPIPCKGPPPLHPDCVWARKAIS